MTTQILEASVAKPGTKRSEYVRWFDEIGIEDVPLVGGKNASLGEMYRELAPQGVNLANGFAITADAYRYFSADADLDVRIRDFLAVWIRTTSKPAPARPARSGTPFWRRTCRGSGSRDR